MQSVSTFDTDCTSPFFSACGLPDGWHDAEQVANSADFANTVEKGSKKDNLRLKRKKREMLLL